MGPASRPAAEVDLDEELVASLVAVQHPDLAAPVRAVASGWDNAMFRLGDELAVRLPRRALAAELVAHEVRWLPGLAAELPLAVPVPVREGHPALGYPWSWSIVRWVPGQTVLASSADLDEPTAAIALAEFVRALHRPAPPDAPHNPFRGVPLRARAERFVAHLQQAPPAVDRATVAAAWDRAVTADPWDGPAMWVHGDLHPGNLVTLDGRLRGVIDFGDLTAGDPAVDLGVAWMFLGAAGRTAFRESAGADEATWERARGSALAHAMAVLAHSSDDPLMAAMALQTVDAVLEG